MPNPVPPRESRPKSPRKLARAITVLTLAAAALSVPAASASATPLPSCTTAGVAVTSLGGPNFYIDSGASPAFRSGYTGYRITNATGAEMSDTWMALSNFTGGSLALASGQSAAQRAGDLSLGGSIARYWYLTASAESSTAQNHTITVYRGNPALPNAVALCTTTGGFSSVAGTLAASANKVTGISVTGAAPKLGSTFTVNVTGNTGTIGSGVSGDVESLWMSPAVVENWPADAFRLLATSLTISPDGTAAQQTYTDTLRVANLGSTARAYTASYTLQAVGFTTSATTLMPIQEIASGTQVKHTGSFSVSLPAIQPPVNDLTATVAASATKLNSGGGTVTLTGSVAGTAGAELDSFWLSLPAGATVVPGSAKWGGTAIADPVASGGKQVFSGPFVVGSKKLTVDVAFDGTSGERSISLVGKVGTAIVGSSTSVVDGSNAATVTVNVNSEPTAGNGNVTTTPNVPVSLNTATLAADADADAWTLSTAGPAGHGTVSTNGRLVTYQPDENYEGADSFSYTVDDGRGGTATGTISVLVDPEATPPPVSAATQAISFAAPSDLGVGDTGPLSASADSGLAVTFSSDSPAVCSVSGAQVTALAEGSCSVTASQPGDETWAPAAPVSRSFTVSATVMPEGPVTTPQSILFAQPDPVAVGDNFDVTASADSGLAVTVVSETPDVCTITGATVSALGVGDCVLTASQPGDSTYDAATSVSRTVSVGPAAMPSAPAAQSIAFEPPASVLGLTPGLALTATASSGLPVTLQVSDGSCTLQGGTLTASAAGQCTVHATQAGDSGNAPATPVDATIGFVVPVDDSASTAGATPVAVDVLANDPDGVTITSVDTPAHGSASVVDGKVSYAPAGAFRGTDTFTYTVTDGDRTASASISVTVANQAPSLPSTALTQNAGTTGVVTLVPSDPNGDPVTLSATSDDPLVSVGISGTKLTLTVSAAASGNVTIAVTATDDAGGSGTAPVHVRVVPPAPENARRSLSADGTVVRWNAAPTAGGTYQVLLDRKVVCRTAKTSCGFGEIAGPKRSVTVRTIGRDGTVSVQTAAPLRGHGEVLITTVYYASGSAALTRTDRRILDRAIGKIHRYGFGTAALDGYTDSDGGYALNLALSKRRTAGVAAYLRSEGEIGSIQSWHGEANPVASNRGADGKAKNRRVEILVRY